MPRSRAGNPTMLSKSARVLVHVRKRSAGGLPRRSASTAGRSCRARRRSACPPRSTSTSAARSRTTSSSFVHDDGRHPVVRAAAQDGVAGRAAHLDVHVRERLVGDQHARLQHQSTCERDALPHPRAEFVRILRRRAEREHELVEECRHAHGEGSLVHPAVAARDGLADDSATVKRAGQASRRRTAAGIRSGRSACAARDPGRRTGMPST